MNTNKLYTVLEASAVGNRKSQGGGTESMWEGQVIALTRVVSVSLSRGEI